MPRGAQPKIAERESRMIYAAIKLFLENGYEQTTTVAIAQAAGMSSSAFFCGICQQGGTAAEADQVDV